MNAPPFPLNPTVGQRFGQWVWNGGRWVCSPATGVQVIIQTFTASGPYMPSPGLVTAVVECWGAGGAGGGVGEPSSNEALGGSGGGSGGYSKKALAAALVAGGVQVTIGVGGAYGPNSGKAPDGTATSFGALCVANGGIGGWAMFPSVSDPEPGGGAPPGVGDVASPGATGAPGYWLVFTAPQTNYSSATQLGGQINGGNAGLMLGANNGFAGPSGAPNSGAGGAGATANQLSAPTSFAGGGGGSGLCVVTEYCWMDVVPDDCTDTVNMNARVTVDGRGGWSGAPYVDHRGGEFGDD